MTRAAVLTMVKDESIFFPIWLGYYAKFFAPEDMYVLDHGSRDGSTDRGAFVRVRMGHPTVDWAWHRDTLQSQQHALLDRYDAVLVTDVDEIVAPHPHTGDRGSYLAAFDMEFVTCRGYEIIHMRDEEPPFDPARGILDQRGWWYSSPAYCKPLLARTKMHWRGGFHARTDGRSAPDGILHLLHLHRMDFDVCLARNHQRISVPWNKRDWEEGWAYQHRIVDPSEFSDWFYNDSGVHSYAVAPEPIPSEWRLVV